MLNFISNVQQHQQHQQQQQKQQKQQQQQTSPVERLGNVFIKDDVLDFPDTEIGKSKEIKFRLCNDGAEVKRVSDLYCDRILSTIVEFVIWPILQKF